ncbi:MAG: HAD-IA family hydrolase [Acidimicrobiia bacterium]|nr:HAD-IA family hydrolase [Acidimicrobiia bacterium]
MNTTHILIDLDGTLSDSEPGITSCLRAALIDEGLPVPPPDVLRQVIGPPFELGLPLIGVPGDRLWAVIDHYRQRYERDGLYDTVAYDGVAEMLDRLAAAGFVLALATAKPEPTAVRVVEHLGFTDRFAALVGASFEPGRRTKGEVIAHALVRLGIEAGPHVVMVGDRSHDVEGARQHGIGTIGVLWGYGSEDELRAAGASVLATHPSDVGDLLTPAGAPTTGTT